MSDLQLRQIIRQLKINKLDTALWHQLLATATRDGKFIEVTGVFGAGSSDNSRKFSGRLVDVRDSEVGCELSLKTEHGGGSIFSNEVIPDSIVVEEDNFSERKFLRNPHIFRHNPCPGCILPPPMSYRSRENFRRHNPEDQGWTHFISDIDEPALDFLADDDVLPSVWNRRRRNPEGICFHCERELPDVQNRYSLGIYAGRYCNACWDASGYRKEGREGFDPADAGESYEDEDDWGGSDYLDSFSYPD